MAALSLRNRLDRFLAPLVLTLAALLLHAGQLAGLRPVWRDSSLMYVPAKHYLAELLHRGVLPEWWPFDALGAPFLAQPMYSTFHPTTAFYAFLPFWPAFTAQDVAATWLALTGTYLLARELAQPRAAALVAAILYGGSGYLVSLSEHQFMKLAAGTLPWYAWAVLFAARRRGAAYVLPALAMGTLLLAGDPQIAILAAITGAVLLFGSRHFSRRSLILAIAAPAAGALVAAIQLVPSMLLLPDTERASTSFKVATWSLGLDDLAATAFPFATRPDTWISTTVFGVAGFALVGAALTRWRRRSVLALVVLAIVSVWLALGDAWGLNAAMRLVVPFWAKLRYPMKSVVAAYLAWSLLAGAGFSRLGRARDRRAAVRAALVAAVGSTGLYVAVFGRAPALGPLLTTAVGLAAVLVLTRRGGQRWSAAAVVSAGTLAYGMPVVMLVDDAAWQPSRIVQALRNAGAGLEGPAFDRWDDRPKTPLGWIAENLAVGGGDWSGTSGYFGLPTVTIYQTGASGRLHEVMPFANAEAGLRFSRIYGAGLLVIRSDEAAQQGQVLESFEEFGVSLVRPRQSLARAYAVHRARLVPDAAASAERMRSPAFKPGREILVEGTNAPEDWASRPDAPSIPARIAARTNTRVDLEVEQPWPGFVVLNEAWFPGWTAEVDGKPAPLLVANGAVRAVETAAGPHRIRFAYRTPGLVAGAVVSGTTLIILLGTALFLRRKRNAASPGGPAALRTSGAG